MSYEVTATRRRPQKFDDLVGQEFVAQTLKNSIKSGKIAHAYLFSGPRGCGKTSTARILAKALNCQNGPTDNPCGTCSTCQEITKGSSLDVIEIDGASNTSVENIRQIKDEVLFPPNSCRYKIYIIDEVHMLSTSAFNALLKTIEEPPPYVIFIFATTELQKVPATIKSRCQQFNFRLVAIEKVKQCLAEAAGELNIKADDEALFWIARESTGSMRDAYTLFDQVVAFSEGHITYEKIRDKLGLVGIDRLNTIFESCAYSRTDEVLNSLDEFLQSGISIEQFISNCADYLRSILLIKSGVTKESLLGNSVERYSKVVINAWNAIQVERALSIFIQLYKDIRYSLSPRYELELAFSRMCWIGQYVSNVEVKKAIDGAQALLSQSAGISVQSAPVTNTNVTVSQPVQNNPAAETKVPNGLPRLSMLDNPPSDIEQEEQTPPFLDGGSLPPEQTVQVNTTEENVVNEKLVIHAAETLESQEEKKEEFYVPSSQTYSVNPDIEDDGWTNVDEIPEDDFYPEESYEQRVEEIEQSQQISAHIESDYNSDVMNKTFTTANGEQMTVAQLRGSALATISVEDGFFAAGLEKTGEWIVNDNSIDITIYSEYDKSLLSKNIPQLLSVIEEICGKKMSVNLCIQKKQEQDEQKKVEIPKQVQILCDVFKGNIIAGKQ